MTPKENDALKRLLRRAATKLGKVYGRKDQGVMCYFTKCSVFYF